MPAHTRAAMLDAIRANPIIVGAYTDGHGGVCPMLAAHRNGGRTSFAGFARAWDRYTRAGRRARRATDREVRTLTAMLEASIAIDGGLGGPELARAIAEHRASRARTGPGAAPVAAAPGEGVEAGGSPGARERVSGGRERVSGARERVSGARERVSTGERDRTRELRRRHGWAWLRPFRRLDEYERALAEIAEAEGERPRHAERPRRRAERPRRADRAEAERISI